MSTEHPVEATAEDRVVEVVKGNPTPTQRRALEIFVHELAEKVAKQRHAKPDTRGWYGSPLEPFPDRPEPNPAGFRTPRLPRT